LRKTASGGVLNPCFFSFAISSLSRTIFQKGVAALAQAELKGAPAYRTNVVFPEIWQDPRNMPIPIINLSDIAIPD